ncbi:MAG: hypothetical protein WCG25_00465 [bacterium]
MVFDSNIASISVVFIFSGYLFVYCVCANVAIISSQDKKYFCLLLL